MRRLLVTGCRDHEFAAAAEIARHLGKNFRFVLDDEEADQWPCCHVLLPLKLEVFYQQDVRCHRPGSFLVASVGVCELSRSCRAPQAAVAAVATAVTGSMTDGGAEPMPAIKRSSRRSGTGFSTIAKVGLAPPMPFSWPPSRTRSSLPDISNHIVAGKRGALCIQKLTPSPSGRLMSERTASGIMISSAAVASASVPQPVGR